jgi:hypothetical protein
VGHGSGGGDGNLDHAHKQHGHCDQYDGASDLVGVAERRGLRADSVGHPEHDHHEECTGRGGDPG